MAPAGYRGGYPDEPRYGAVQPREFDRAEMSRPRLGSWLRGSTRGALAMDPRRMAMMFEEGHPLSKITTLRPKDYSEARTIGERFRDGTPVIMDLVSMDNADAKRLVDFAAGLAFALRGSFDKVATKVFLLSPADVDVIARKSAAGSPKPASTLTNNDIRPARAAGQASATQLPLPARCEMSAQR